MTGEIVNHPVRIRLFLWMVTAILVLTACATESASTLPAEDGGIDGEALYVQHCAECHGVDGEGEPDWRTPNEQGVFPAPPHDSSGHTWHHSDQVLLRIIAEGGSMPNSGMPGFAKALDPAEMEAILAYIKTFWGSRELEFQQEVSR
jgi:mono/diheme cytochrome c family protein